MDAHAITASHQAETWSPSSDASDIVKSIHAMLHPRNIVLVGATDKPGNYAERIWNNLIKYKYEGGLFPVNAKRETIWGVPCYKDFASLPEKPDHVLVLVPARFAVQVIRDAAAAGARSATIVTSGFSELQDEESQRLAVELKEAVRETGLAVTGPNCLGNLSAGEGGRAAAMAHTGALAGSIETFDAISTREGVIRVRGLDELIETTECFVHAEPPKSNRLAAVSLSGGKRGLLIDAFYSAGLNFAPLSKNTSAQLTEMLGPGSIVGNPLDAGFAAVVDPTVYMKSIKIMIDDPDTDIVIIDADLPKAPHALRERNLRIVNDMAGEGNKPVIYISAMSIGFTEHTKAVRKSLPNIAVMQGLDRAVGAIKPLIEYSSLRKEVPDIVSSSKASARAVLEKALKNANGAAALDEVASKKLLKAYGIPVSREEIAQTAAEAVKIAKKIGFPVVAKVVSADILHKSDIGGVVLNLNSAAEVKKAFNDITARVKKIKSKPKLEGILIAQQVKADLELVVGASLDAEMGPVVLFGTGGVDIELMKDVALAGAPLDEAEAKQLIAKTKAGVKMKGYRGKPALHEASAVKALVGLSNLMADAGNRIASIDVNPFLINSKVGVAVDGLIVLNNDAANKAAKH